MRVKSLMEIWKTMPSSHNLFESTNSTINAIFSNYNGNSNKIDRMILMSYGTREFMFFDDDTSIFQQFNDCFNAWVSINKDNLMRLKEGLSLEYNPIENYSKELQTTTEYQGTETDRLSKNGSEQVTTDPFTDTSTNASSPQSDNVFYNTEQNTLTGGTRKSTNSFNNRYDENIKTYTNRKDIVTSHENGNIGIQTPMNMLDSEYKGRMLMNLEMELLRNFICEFTF